MADTVIGPCAGQPSVCKIGTLAAPALVVLAAEPLYALVDTAVAGHLGQVPLAAVALGGIVLSLAAVLGNFPAYGTTGRSARHHGAGGRASAVDEGVQASWLAFGLGLGFAVLAQLVARPVVGLLAGDEPGATQVAANAEIWLRIASLGAPGILLTLAGNGWLRGVHDARRPMRYVLSYDVPPIRFGPEAEVGPRFRSEW